MTGTTVAQALQPDPLPHDRPRRHPHWIVDTHHRMRAASFANAFAFCGLQLWALGWPAWAWVLLALQFLVYPHLLYWRALNAADTQQAELQNLLLDCLLMGLWVAAMGFPLWITFTLFISTTINNAISQGYKGVAMAMGLFGLGALLAYAAAGQPWHPGHGAWVTTLCALGLGWYLLGIGHVAFSRARPALHARAAQAQRTGPAAGQRGPDPAPGADPGPAAAPAGPGQPRRPDRPVQPPRPAAGGAPRRGCCRTLA